MNGKGEKVVLGMSGGVDSSVAALLLKEAGFQVIGLSMILYTCESASAKGCCTPADRWDARRVCEQLDIPHEIVDLRVIFKKMVVDTFADSYAAGQTPLPCVPCNSEVRFRALAEAADRHGAPWIATGHYARVERGVGARACLKRARDRKKDQSYFLWGLSALLMDRLLLPLGELTKQEVREKAARAGLKVHDKAESQDLCFVGEGHHAEFIESHYPHKAGRPGDFTDAKGKKLGRHRGIHWYTIGQRRGLALGLPERHYVAGMDISDNRVILKTQQELYSDRLAARDCRWHVPPDVLEGRRLTVKIRSTHDGSPARLERTAGGFRARFETPQFAITPGQAAVCYDGDTCLGGGWIEGRGAAEPKSRLTGQ